MTCFSRGERIGCETASRWSAGMASWPAATARTVGAEPLLELGLGYHAEHAGDDRVGDEAPIRAARDDDRPTFVLAVRRSGAAGHVVEVVRHQNGDVGGNGRMRRTVDSRRLHHVQAVVLEGVDDAAALELVRCSDGDPWAGHRAQLLDAQRAADAGVHGAQLSVGHGPLS